MHDLARHGGGAEAAQDGTIELFNRDAATVTQSITCPKNSLNGGAGANMPNPTIQKFTAVSLANNTNYALRAKAGTNSPVFWRDVQIELQ